MLSSLRLSPRVLLRPAPLEPLAASFRSPNRPRLRSYSTARLRPLASNFSSGSQASGSSSNPAFPGASDGIPPPPPRSPGGEGKGKGKKRLRNLAIGVTGLGVLAAYDHLQLADAISRTLRTGIYGLAMAIDFKLNFNPENSESIDALHERVAWRIHHICTVNGGMYIKLAQSIALQASILPKPYRDALGNVFDQAPTQPYSEVVKIFTNEFGVHPDEAFEYFNPIPAASASIAQVHKARLRRKEGEPAWGEDEGWVAVKVRKSTVPKQIEWDLFAYRTLLYVYEKLFDLPVSFVAEYVSMQMRKEVDLLNEARNAQRAADSLATEPWLRERVMIPKVYLEWTGESIMTADYITAVKLTDKEALLGMGVTFKEVMDTATALFAAQTFKFGFLHGDPHPGNVLVRIHPNHPGRPQIVLLDHGLYVDLPPKFREQYCLLWRSLFIADIKTIEDIALSWGIARENSDMFASMTLLRPHQLRKKAPVTPAAEKSTYEAQTGLKDRLRSMLENEQLIPRELIFLTRSFRMVQASNQTLGSPSNRITILAHWASIGLELTSPTSRSIMELGVRSFVADRAQLLLFKFTLTLIDIGFMLNQLRQWVLAQMGTKTGEGFEDVLQRQVTEMARSEFGVELDDSAFNG